MSDYRVNFRLWALLTTGLCAVFVVWEHIHTQQYSFWTHHMRLASGTDPEPDGLVKAVMADLGLILIAGTVALVICTLSLQLAWRLNPQPSSLQDADYDDPPANP